MALSGHRGFVFFVARAYLFFFLFELLPNKVIFKVEFGNFSLLFLARLLLVALLLVVVVILEEGLVVTFLEQLNVVVIVDQVWDALFLPQRILHLQYLLLVVLFFILLFWLPSTCFSLILFSLMICILS